MVIGKHRQGKNFLTVPFSYPFIPGYFYFVLFLPGKKSIGLEKRVARTTLFFISHGAHGGTERKRKVRSCEVKKLREFCGASRLHYSPFIITFF